MTTLHRPHGTSSEHVVENVVAADTLRCRFADGALIGHDLLPK
ncbi:hypothetical protein HMPREF9607_00206 [Cutibacterium modestum HL044PA1]|uniref:Uncharacterized protein n=1 Tax=Cutibacterium modestum HL044PA1 TaxID=765109 RepID=A0ABN0C8U7_9ACTN|nr:hypothetical protein HMPREF9607_00206 [Cutibacterium modestum HL044PA1]